LTTELSSQALSTLFHLQKFAAYVIDYYDQRDYIELRAEFNRILREQDGYPKLVDKVKHGAL
jgi:hypothetical protein